MQRVIKSRKQISAYLLIAPLFLFVLLFFVWPLFSMLQTAVLNEAVSKALPRTSLAVSTWNGSQPIPFILQQSLLEDLQEIQEKGDRQSLGRATQQLNSSVSGYRSLIAKTQRKVSQLSSIDEIDLAQIDKRWTDERFWLALKQSANPWSDKNLLNAVDMQRNLHGEITVIPAHQSANNVVLLRTFEIAFQVTLLCLLLGVPYALLMVKASGFWRVILMGAVLVPLWTSLLVRSAAWVVLLQDFGPINQLLIALGWISEPLSLIFNRSGVLIAMTQVLLPFMVLPVYNALLTIPPNLAKAAASLGATPFTVFFKVLFPLFSHGVFAGALLVFMTAIGYYITPALVGGAKDQMISSIIAFYAIETANWGMAAALGVILLVITVLLYSIQNRFAQHNTGQGA